MNVVKWFRDVVLVPVIIAFVFMVYGAWYSGVKWHAPFSTAWLMAVFTTPVPLWSLVCVMVAGAALGGSYRYTRAALLAERAKSNALLDESVSIRELHAQEQMALIGRHQLEIRTLRAPESRIEAVWEDTMWGEDMVNNQPAIYLSGWAFFSLRNARTPVVLVQASVNGSEPISINPIQINLGAARRIQLFTNVVPPIGMPGEPLNATITFTDNRNARYVMPERTFQWSSSPGDSLS